MADTIPDITVVNTSWVNVYSSAGITVGDNLIVTNKSSSPILLVEAISSPLPNVTDGVPLQIGMQAIINNTPNGLFARLVNGGSGPLSVQRGSV